MGKYLCKCGNICFKSNFPLDITYAITKCEHCNYHECCHLYFIALSNICYMIANYLQPKDQSCVY